MSLPFWRKWWTRTLTGQGAPGRKACRLRLESLEERLSPAIYTITSNTDSGLGANGTTNPGQTQGDIRYVFKEASKAANAGSTINFGVTGFINLTLGELPIQQPTTVTGP